MNPLLIVFFLSFILLAAYGFYAIFKEEKLDITSFEGRWRGILLEHVDYYKNLIPEERTRFELDILKFFDKIRINGVDTKIGIEEKLLVASSGVIPLFGYPGSSFDNLSEVLIYKGTFGHDYNTEGKDRNILGMVGTGNMNRHMILSKPALWDGYDNSNSSRNVGIHEFVHLLDMADGDTDGIPKFVLKSKEVKPWLKVVHGEIENILAGKSKINPYGATSEVEFFSVASEYFFMKPTFLQSDHPELYSKLVKIYHQDPAKGLGNIIDQQ